MPAPSLRPRQWDRLLHHTLRLVHDPRQLEQAPYMPNRVRPIASTASAGPPHFDLRGAATTEEIQQQLPRRSNDASNGFASPGPYGSARPSPLELKSGTAQPPREKPWRAIDVAPQRRVHLGEFIRGKRPPALRTSSWWTKNSLRLGNCRTQLMRKKPRGGPDRIVATSQVKSFCASASLRRSAKWPHAPGMTSPGAATGSCSRSTRCDARSRVVHGFKRVGASGPSSSSRSASSSARWHRRAGRPCCRSILSPR